MTGGQRRFAMRRGGGDEHDAVAGLEPAIAVDDQHSVERPAPVCLGLDLGELFFGHPWIMFEAQGGNPIVAAHIAHQSDKARDSADTVIAGGEALDLGPDIEIFTLHSDHCLSLR